jgi:hypothetical protein
MSLITNRVVNFCDMKLTLNCRWSLSEGHLPITAVGLRSVGFGATHFSLDKSRMGADTFKLKNPTFLKPTVTSWAFFFTYRYGLLSFVN